MNRAFKRYRKARWIDTRFARPYKFELFLLKARLAGVASQALFNVRQIHQNQMPFPVKASSVIATMLRSQRVVTKEVQAVRNRWRAAQNDQCKV